MKRLFLLAAIILLGTSACSWNESNGFATTTAAPLSRTAPTVVVIGTAATEISMYVATVKQFFADNTINEIFEADTKSYNEAYIQPTFDKSSKPLPAEVIQLIEAHLDAHRYAMAQQKEEAGVEISMSEIGADKDYLTATGEQYTPTIWFTIGLTTSKYCGATIRAGYTLTRQNGGWIARQYAMAIC